MAEETVDWGRVNKWVEREGVQTHWRVYGAPAIMAVDKSAYSDAVPMPRWDLPGKVMVSTAINGAFFTKNENPNQPISVEEIINSAEECIAAGAQVIHVHVRDERGYNVLDTGMFTEVLSHLRSKHNHIALDACLVAVNADESQQMDEMLAKGLMDAVPVNTTAIMLGDNVFVKSPHAIMEKARRALAAGMRPQIAVYTDADVDNARRYLLDSGILQGPQSWLLLPGLPGCSPMYTPEMMCESFLRMVRLIKHVDPGANIIACTGGRTSTYLANLAILMGCNVRIGMEDTVWKWPHRDDLITSNSEIFRMVKTLVETLGRELMTGAEYRQLVKLEQ